MDNSYPCCTFYSRRNQVLCYKTESVQIVKKVFRDLEGFRREIAVYQSLASAPIKTSQILKIGDGALWLTYLPGITMVEVLESQERQRQIDWSVWDKLVRWLEGFTSATNLIMSDINLRNFIYDPISQSIAGVDFEECCQGDALEMAAELIAFVKLYNPAYTAIKAEIADYISIRLTKNQPVERNRLEMLIDLKEQKIKQRRLKKQKYDL